MENKNIYEEVENDLKGCLEKIKKIERIDQVTNSYPFVGGIIVGLHYLIEQIKELKSIGETNDTKG